MNISPAKMKKLTGSLKYPRLENSTQTCQVNFSLEFEFFSIRVEFHDITKNNTHETNSDLKVTEWNEHSCDDIDEEQRRVIRTNTLQAMIDRVEKTLFTNSKLPFQSILEGCEHLLNDFNETARDYHVRFKSGYNPSTISWKAKKSDILIRGLHNFILHMHHFEDTVHYEIEFPHTTIEWEIQSIITQYFAIKSQHITMNGTFNEFTDNAFNIRVKLLKRKLYLQSGPKFIAAPAEEIKNLEAFIAQGIDQELRIDEQRDITANFRNIIRETMYRFGNLFYANKRKDTYVFNIESDDLQNSNEYIKCSFNKSLEVIDALTHKQVTAQINLQYQAGNEAMKEISAFIKMKNFNSMPYNFLLDTKELETEIERNLIVSKKTITILSTHRYERRDRIGIGKAVFGSFFEEMKDRIISVAESIRPIPDTCKDHVDELRRLYSNYQKNHKDYILFLADWIDIVDPFTNRYVKILLNGTGTFKSINMRHSNRFPVFIDLRIENITGSIKQIDALDPDTAVELNFIVKSLSIKSDYESGTISAEVPNSKQFFITSTTPHSNSSSIRTNVIIKKFQESIISFIRPPDESTPRKKSKGNFYYFCITGSHSKIY
ncbi:uncharacterized protein LOC135834262 [Planococcus citri]|uniref:uncharacterized protein LOC135834262 n=1 Tax=Planococcus citri TaxID=170843 RepID=UPI0031F82B64